ncbi:hypothetical protein C8R45DRAFT_1114367 [Mycena sanguinolenta]|nr:hypothetical protein C8R45DRAFT_1114367 [Mycena sanguinolenta]
MDVDIATLGCTPCLVPLPLSAWLEVAVYSSLTELLSLLQLSRSINIALRYLLYRDIVVGASAQKLLTSLAANLQLRPLVRFLIFEDPSAHIHPRLWALVFPTLENLEALTIAYEIPLSHPIVSEAAFRLTFFESLCPLTYTWAQLVASQPGLEELILHEGFWTEAPAPHFLPRLRRIRGYPADIAKFAQFYALEHMWFISKKPLPSGRPTLRSRTLPNFASSACRLSTVRISAPDFLRLSTASPDIISMLRHLVLDEDLTWSEFLLQSDVHGLGGSTFGQVAAVLGRNFPFLRSVLLVCSQSPHNRNYRPLLQRVNARCFAKILAGHCSAPGLEAFRFYAEDGYAVWTDWGKETEQIWYGDEQDTNITTLEPEYGHLF